MWKKILKEQSGEEKFFINANGNSFISGTVDNYELRFGLKQGIFSKIRDLARENRDAYDSYSIQETNNGIVVNFEFDDRNEQMEDKFDLLASKIDELLTNSKYVQSM